MPDNAAMDGRGLTTRMVDCKVGVCVQNTAFIALLLLIIKHWVCDGPLQTPYQYRNKGKFGHPGGLLHSGIQGLGSGICLIPLFGLSVGGLLALADAVVHYFADWVKSNFGKGGCELREDHLRITTDRYFWWLVADQCIHFATYVSLVYLAPTVDRMI